MIRFTLCGIKIRLSFGFFFTAAFLILLSGEISEIALLACILHEAGHILAMKLLGMKIRLLSLGAFGIKLVPAKSAVSPTSRMILILSAGCAVNFLLFLIFPKSSFGAVNLCLGAFNLLPAGGLDGGRILKCATEYFFPYSPRISSHIRKAASVFCCALLSAFFICGHYANPSVFLAVSFILLSAVAD